MFALLNIFSYDLIFRQFIFLQHIQQVLKTCFSTENQSKLLRPQLQYRTFLNPTARLYKQIRFTKYRSLRKTMTIIFACRKFSLTAVLSKTSRKLFYGVRFASAPGRSKRPRRLSCHGFQSNLRIKIRKSQFVVCEIIILYLI